MSDTILVLTPNQRFAGVRLGVTFRAGEAVAPASLADGFARLGYTVVFTPNERPSDDVPSAPSPRRRKRATKAAGETT